MPRHLNDAHSAEATPPAVAEYLRELETLIPSWLHGRRSALAELADGLRDATEHYRSRGMEPDAAAARALRDCGPAPLIASEFAAMLATGHARRTAIALMATGPVVGVLWLMTLVPGQTPDALLMHYPVLGMLVLASVTCALLTILTTGPAIRWLPPMRLVPRRIAAAACAAAAIGDLLLLIIAAQVALGPAPDIAWMPGLIACVTSVVRLTLTQRVARRDLQTSELSPHWGVNTPRL
jgi:hypothetical protein